MKSKEKETVFTCPLCGNITVQVCGADKNNILRCNGCGATTKHLVTGSGERKPRGTKK